MLGAFRLLLDILFFHLTLGIKAHCIKVRDKESRWALQHVTFRHIHTLLFHACQFVMTSHQGFPLFSRPDPLIWSLNADSVVNFGSQFVEGKLPLSPSPHKLYANLWILGLCLPCWLRLSAGLQMALPAGQPSHMASCMNAREGVRVYMRHIIKPLWPGWWVFSRWSNSREPEVTCIAQWNPITRTQRGGF